MAPNDPGTCTIKKVLRTRLVRVKMPQQSTLDSFRRAGQSHLYIANRVLENRSVGGSNQEPVLKAGSAAYLAHVSVECAIKARLLSRGGFACAEDLEKKQPQIYSTLFRSKSGHDLQKLADHLGIKRFLESNGKTWLDDDCWKRMVSPARPYSLRYGIERITLGAAEEEIKRATELVAVLTDAIWIVPLKKR